MSAPPLEILSPGPLDYDAGLALQHDLSARVLRSPDRLAFLVLTAHPPVFTLGRNADPRHVRVPEAFLRERGIALRRTDRGGEVTYHGPGQLVGYPILSLRAFRLTVRRYVCLLERTLLSVLAEAGIAAARREGTAGIWAGEGKIASIGIRVDRGITRHGFALNVANDLTPFAWIDPCGVPGARMTSVARQTGREEGPEEWGDRFARALASGLQGAGENPRFRACRSPRA